LVNSSAVASFSAKRGWGYGKRMRDRLRERERGEEREMGRETE
jgi:hypothetical protein